MDVRSTIRHLHFVSFYSGGTLLNRGIDIQRKKKNPIKIQVTTVLLIESNGINKCNGKL